MKMKAPILLVRVIEMRATILLAASLMCLLVSSPARSQNAARDASVGAKVATTEAAKSDSTIPPGVGQPAPDFRLPYATQEKIYFKPDEHLALNSLRGKNVILAFYPADWSSGCTTEVCTLRDTFAELAKLNAT